MKRIPSFIFMLSFIFVLFLSALADGGNFTGRGEVRVDQDFNKVKTARPPGWVEPDTDRPGSDYKSFYTSAGPEACQEVCANDPNCRAYTYVRPGIQGRLARCWLKSGVPASVSNDCCVSGVKPSSSSTGVIQKVLPVQPGAMVSGDKGSKPSVQQPAAPSAGIIESIETAKRPDIQTPQTRQPLSRSQPPAAARKETVISQGEKQPTPNIAEEILKSIEIGGEPESRAPSVSQPSRTIPQPQFSRPQTGRLPGSATGNMQQPESPFGDIMKSIGPPKASPQVVGEIDRQTGEVKTNRETNTEVPGAKVVDLSVFSGGMLMVDAIRAATERQPDCNDLSASMSAMMNGGNYARMDSGSLEWRPAGQTKLSLKDARIQSIIASSKGDLNAQIRGFTDLHNKIRKSKLISEFKAAPSIDQKIAALVNSVSDNLHPDKFNRLEQMKLIKSSAGSKTTDVSRMKQKGMADPSMATAARILEVCSMRKKTSKTPEKDKVLWEKGYAFLLGKNFGWEAGDIYLDYTDCGGTQGGCEDLRFSGQPIPVKRLRLELISKSAWSDRLIGIKIPGDLPLSLVNMSVGQGVKIWVRPAKSQSAVPSPLVRFKRIEPDVTTIKTDSGFDPGGLILYGNWVSSSGSEQPRHDIFWIRPQKLVHGAGLININCPACPRGKRLERGHLASPGDNIYIFGQGFESRPGEIFLTYDDPTAPGTSLRKLRRSIPVEPGGTDWWKDDRIHIRIKPNVPPPDSQRFPRLVIVDQNGRWIWVNGIIFSPKMAIKVVSGERWLQMHGGEQNKYEPLPDGSAMVVSHPTGGCDSFLGIPTDTNEKGYDSFFYQTRPQSGIKVISEEFIQIPPGVSAGKYVAKFFGGLGQAVAREGLAGIFTYYGKFALSNISRSIGGDRGAHYIYPQKKDWTNTKDPRATVEWENTCVGPNANKPVRYIVRFILSGPEHLLYPGR